MWHEQVLEDVLKDVEKKVSQYRRLQGDSFKRSCRAYAAMVSGSAWVLKEPFLQEAKELVGRLSSPAGLTLFYICHICEGVLKSWVSCKCIDTVQFC